MPSSTARAFPRRRTPSGVRFLNAAALGRRVGWSHVGCANMVRGGDVAFTADADHKPSGPPSVKVSMRRGTAGGRPGEADTPPGRSLEETAVSKSKTVYLGVAGLPPGYAPA